MTRFIVERTQYTWVEIDVPEGLAEHEVEKLVINNVDDDSWDYDPDSCFVRPDPNEGAQPIKED